MTGAVERYYGEIGSLLQRIVNEEQRAVRGAATALADVIARDRLIAVIGPGGHSNIGAEEMFYRSGGFACVWPVFDPGFSLAFGARRSTAVERVPGYVSRVLATCPITKDDALIIVNAYGINSATIDAALYGKTLGAPTVGVTSPSFSRGTPPDHPARHPSKRNLCDLVDHVIDTKMPARDAVLEFERLETLVAPTSTVLNAFALECVVAATVEILLSRGHRPPIWTSSNVTGGEAANQSLMERYRPRVPFL
jgi:uncharacterized phosphosugar-binding protein